MLSVFRNLRFWVKPDIFAPSMLYKKQVESNFSPNSKNELDYFHICWPWSVKLQIEQILGGASWLHLCILSHLSRLNVFNCNQSQNNLIESLTQLVENVHDSSKAETFETYFLKKTLFLQKEFQLEIQSSYSSQPRKHLKAKPFWCH